MLVNMSWEIKGVGMQGWSSSFGFGLRVGDSGCRARGLEGWASGFSGFRLSG